MNNNKKSKILDDIINDNINRTFNKTLFFLHTYSMPVQNLLASPLKKTTAYISIIVILILIFKHFNILRYFIRLDYINLYYILLPFIGVVIYINQYKTNNDIIELYNKGLLNANSTLYDYAKLKIPESKFITIFWSTLLSILISDFVIFNFTLPFKDASVDYLNNFKRNAIKSKITKASIVSSIF